MNHKRVDGREGTERLETRKVVVSDTKRVFDTAPLDGLPTTRGAALVLDRYLLETAIGMGGHGSVWRAFDEKLRRPVAVKVIPRANASGDRRAEREAQAAARLNHPAIVALYELGQDDGAIYLVSELVEGRTLADLEAEGAASDRDLAEIGVALCAALAHAHRRGVIHRDVKPQNVLVADEPAAGAGFAKLADFGIARLVAEEPLTATGGVVGTLAYMAPEQAAGSGADAAADVYSLALTLHEGFSGVRPEGPSRRPRPLRTLRRDLPPELSATIDDCLDDRPEARPLLGELREALDRTLDELSSVDGLVAPGPLERVGLTLPARRRPNVPGLPDAPASVRLPQRLVAAVGAATATLAVTALLGAGAVLGFTPALLAGVACLLLPRVGWLVTAVGICSWLVADGHTGVALVVAIPAFTTPALMPRAGFLWSLPALAPVLGYGGLAAAFPAVAGLAGGVWRRVALSLAGIAWLLAAEAIAGTTLLQGPAAGTEAVEVWADSAIGAARDAVYPALTEGLVLTAFVWAAFAAVAPLVGRTPRGLPRFTAAAVWAGAQAFTAAALADAAGLARPAGLLVGAAVGAAILVAAYALADARSIGRREGF